MSAVAGEVGIVGVAEVSPPDSARGYVVADRGGEAVDGVSDGGSAPAGTTVDDHIVCTDLCSLFLYLNQPTNACCAAMLGRHQRTSRRSASTK